MMSQSVQEEILSAFWLIAGLLALIAGIEWLAKGLFLKAALDSLCAVYVALRPEKNPG